MRVRNVLRGNLSKVLAGDLGSQAVGILRGLIIPLLVAPAAYGLWRLVLLVWQYGVYLHVGTFALLNREQPGLLAIGDAQCSAKMRQTAFWGTMLVTGIAAFCVLMFSCLPIAGSDRAARWALRFAALGIVLQQLYLYLMVQFRVRSEFGSMSLLGFTQTCATFLLMIPLGYLAGVPGLAAGMAGAAAVGLVTFARKSEFEPPRLRLAAFGRQVAAGVPLSSLPFLNATITSVGQVVSAAVLGLEATGLLGLGIMLGTIVYAVPRAIGMVVYPRYLASYAKDAASREIGILLRRSLRVTSVVSALAACGAAILLEPFYTYVFPKYAQALSASYPLVAMMPFVSYAFVLQNALLALRRHPQVIALQCAAVATSAALSYLGAHSSAEVLGVALGVMTAHLVSGMGTLWLGLASTRDFTRSVTRDCLAELGIVLGLTSLGGGALWAGKILGEGLPVALIAGLQLVALAPVAGWLLMRTWREVRAV
jgi:O-antigen/teichoic acid export membrane protein